MLDVDGFKQFNDIYGHAAGDLILRELGALLIKHTRAEDIPSRYGGDEFIIVLPDASKEMTRERAEALCEYAKQIQLLIEEKNIAMISLSLGVAAFPEDGDTSAAILKAVDTALYRAKRGGRGRVVAAN
ncbi:MAG: GGDEF domain-containing protein [Anaerolineales bacterium]|nr:GGDEF domain-containing protein [Anaerolineales bacterium]